MVNVLFQYTHLTKTDPQLIVYIEYKKRGDFIMRIALINENSQAAKNEMIYASLKKVAESKGHTVDNYGMYSADDKAQLTYVQNGILAAILLNSGAADFVVTGCGTGEGAMLALNSFPGVLCGHVVTLKQDLVEVLKELDQDLVKGAVAGEKFEELFFANCKNEKIAEYVKTLR